jgi:protein-S-isoprenylcysteine O-methyltransferase Ste14
MNTGYWIVGLGVLGLIVGAAMYAASWHRTIGLGGVVLGVILILAGYWLSRGTKKTPVPPPAQPGTAS